MTNIARNRPRTGAGLRSGWLLPVIIALGGCQGTPPVAAVQPATTAALSACEKAETMWRTRILPSRYEQLPPLTGVGFTDLLAITHRAFARKAFTTEGDELEAGRSKRIHAFGAEARLRLVVSPGASGRYSGFFQSGAECAIGRFSLANKPTAHTSIPALAIKLFVDGNHPSLNLHLMNSVDGQDGHDFFANDFSNILPPARSFATQILDRAFRAVAEDLGAKDTNPGRLTLEHLAALRPDGEMVMNPVTPYRLVLRPTATARALMPDATAADDFRTRLADLPPGAPIYDVFALEDGESADDRQPLGQLILTSPVVASSYGDKSLYFQHHTERK